MSSRRSRSGGMGIWITRSADSRGRRGSARSTPRPRGCGWSPRSGARRRRVAVLPPTRSTTPSWSTRSSFAWSASGASPISSRNSVPPFATSNFPGRSAMAPVKAPRSCPNSSLSSSSIGTAARLTGTRSASARGLRRWIARATSSFPVPVSPVMSTEALLGATCCTSAKTLRIAAETPISSSKPPVSESTSRR